MTEYDMTLISSTLIVYLLRYSVLKCEVLETFHI